jgi:hypothetical protein
MPLVDGSYINPFYQQVDKEVVGELNARAHYYGSRTRSTRSGAYEKGIAWSYQRKSWARIKSINPSYILGMAGSKIMSNRVGDLTLYNTQRNVPNKALLQSLELTNEGTIGSLMKGKFTFVIYPKMTNDGFELGKVERAFFTPGGEVEVSWGWSVSAANSRSNMGRFKGIIYNFNWSINPDLSINADCSIVSAATIALGHSGDLNTKKDELNPPSNVLGSPIPGPNLAAVIDRDLTTPGFAAYATMAAGTTTPLIPGVEGNSLPTVSGGTPGPYISEYYGIGLPHQEVEPETNAPAPAGTPSSAVTKVSAPPPPVVKSYFYIKLGSIVDFINNLIDKLEATAGTKKEVMGKLFEVQVWSNITAYNPIVKSAFPFDVFFPDDKMGFYGPTLNPYAAGGFLRSVPAGYPGKSAGSLLTTDISIANILLGTDFVKNTYKEFVEENSANIPHKNISSFFEAIVKKINEASGDMYQLSVVQFDKRDMNFASPNAAATTSARKDRSILSIEDTLLSETITSLVKPYEFGVNIFKPLIKTASISCKPPAAMATAAYASARDTSSGAGTLKPNNSLVDATPSKDKDKPSFDQERTGPSGATGVQDDIFKKAYTGGTSGFNNSWSEQMRGSLTAWKKSVVDRPTAADGNNQTHWLNSAAYPIDLTLTIDGINGFKFGDVIKTTAIPKRYNQEYKMVFTVTKISHKIDSSTWETTLQTKARIKMA